MLYVIHMSCLDRGKSSPIHMRYKRGLVGKLIYFPRKKKFNFHFNHIDIGRGRVIRTNAQRK